jgi:hypothetical protein
MMPAGGVKDVVQEVSRVRALVGGISPRTDTLAGFLKVYRVYFDASGHHEGSTIAVVAGFLAPVDQWDHLEPDWNRILEEERVGLHDPEDGGGPYRRLHMHELRGQSGTYQGLSNKKQAASLGRLATLMRARGLARVGMATSLLSYEESKLVISSTNRLEGSLSPLTFVMMQCLHQVGRWCQKVGIEGPQVSYIFEGGDPNASEVTSVMNEIAGHPGKSSTYRFASWGFGNKRMIGCQAADWYAYELGIFGNREYLAQAGEHFEPKRFPVRKSLVALQRLPQIATGIFVTRDQILKVAKFNQEVVDDDES